MAGSLANVEVFLPLEETVEEGTPVVFIHDILCTKEIWEDIPRKVADLTGRVVYTYDAPCHGTRIDDTEFSFKAIFDDLERMMRELNIGKAILVAHGMGGKAAIRAALERPEKVEKVFIVDMYTRKIPNWLIDQFLRFLGQWRDAVRQISTNVTLDDLTKNSIMELYEKIGPFEQMGMEMESYLNSRFINEKGENDKYGVSFNVDALLKGLWQYKREEDDLSGEYDGLSYFIYGTKSLYGVGLKAREIIEYFPKVKMIPFPGAPHYLFVQSPQKFLEVIVSRINMNA